MNQTQVNIVDFLRTEFELIDVLIHKIQLIRLCIYVEFGLENKVSKGNLVQGQYSPSIMMLVWQISQKF